ncbi:MAG TPA: PKD domain-containing protein [Candidatus Methylomirabilis sp.]|nr:PKD domain-containing protein [Candidatus Methylomirabilis sp.]
MAETRGFEVVAEVKDTVLQGMLRAAWDNGGTSDPGAIPHEVPVPAGTALGPYVASGGQVTIPRTGLSLAMAPADNGVTVQMATDVQVQMDPATTHLQSLSLVEMQATIGITAPFGTIPGSAPNIGIIFNGLPRSKVTVSLTSGDPIGLISLDLVKEYVHGLYTSGVIPHTESFPGETSPPYTYDVWVEIWDDQTNPARAIDVTLPDPTHVRLSLPIHLKLANITGVPGIELLSPMGVLAREILLVEYQHDTTAGKITAKLPEAVVSVEGVGPADGIEGAHYTTAKGINPGIEALFTAAIQTRAQQMVAGLSPMEIPVPTAAQIEQLIGDKAHQALLARQYAASWTPNVPSGSPVTVTEVRPKALANALAIAINPGPGADQNLLTDFVPAGAAFAIALDDAFVHEAIGEVVARPESEGGFGGIPKTFPDIAGHQVDLKSLAWELQSGKIHFTGSCTVHDVFCGADADCDFWADVGLKWSAPDASGGQQLTPYLIDSDASLPWWAWLLAVLGFIIGIIVGVIWLVITIVIDQIADKIGASVISDEVSGQIQTLGAWPQQLQGVGQVTSTFDEAVSIEPSGLVFTGSMLATAQYALTSVSFANAHGPYTGLAASPIVLQAGPASPNLAYAWEFSQGGSASGHQVTRTFIENGLYVARVATSVGEPGGALTHQSALVRVQNVPPVVEAGPDITVKEGETFSLTGHFEDQEWVDKHEAVWDFGDDSLPVKGVVSETNNPPSANGTVSASHAYCTNGDYTVRLRVQDDDGGIGEDTLRVHVENVPPKVMVDPIFFAYPCVPVTLVGRFVDPGWCDKHTATWKFGDGDFAFEATPATVREVNKPPIGYGIAAATHTYRALATHHTECVVVDSDGASGRAQLTVAVVDLMNKDFEAGFHDLPLGTVANEWTPYVQAGSASITPALALEAISPGNAGVLFGAEEFVVRDGQRSQRVELPLHVGAGLFQRVGANPGWDYQVTVQYHIDGRTKGRCRVGIDPRGGQDPKATQAVWAQGERTGDWHPLLVRANAEERRITVFLEAEALDGRAVTYFDAVCLAPFPCKLPDPERPELRPEPRRQCVDMAGERESRSLPSPYSKQGFGFTSLGKRPLRVVLWGEPQGEGKLLFPDEGVRVTLPFVADGVTAQVGPYAGRRIHLRALDAGGKLLGEAESTTDRQMQTLTVSQAGIAGVEITGGNSEGLLRELCVTTSVNTVAELALSRRSRDERS